MKGIQYKCNNLVEVQEATKNLDVSQIVPLKIDFLGNIKNIKSHKGIYNVTKDQFCTTIGLHYNLIQHKEYFDNFAKALKRLNLKYNMSIMSCGNKAFCDIEFKNKNIKFEKLNEEFITGIRLINSYDKSTGLSCMPRFTRLACTNGMVLTRNQKTISIRHNSKSLKEIESFIERKISSIVNEYNYLQTWVNESIKDSTEWQTACKVMEKLFSQPKHRIEILKQLDISMISITDKKTKKVIYNYVLDNKNRKKINRWELYNAITNYITHGEHITPHIESMFQKKAEKLLLTPIVKIPIKIGI